MKKILFVSLTAVFLCACAANRINIKEIDESVWQQDPMNMCSSLIEQNQADLKIIRSRYSADTAQAAASLFQELDLQSNAVCRSRIVQRAQVERLKELRVEYLEKINILLSQEK